MGLSEDMDDADLCVYLREGHARALIDALETTDEESLLTHPMAEAAQRIQRALGETAYDWPSLVR